MVTNAILYKCSQEHPGPLFNTGIVIQFTRLQNNGGIGRGRIRMDAIDYMCYSTLVANVFSYANILTNRQKCLILFGISKNSSDEAYESNKR